MRAVEQTSPRVQSREFERQSVESKRERERERERDANYTRARAMFAHLQKGDVKRQHATARSVDKHDGKLGSALSGAKLRGAMRVATVPFSRWLELRSPCKPLTCQRTKTRSRWAYIVELAEGNRAARDSSIRDTYVLCIPVSASSSQTVERHVRLH